MDHLSVDSNSPSFRRPRRITSPPRAPAPVPCVSRKCHHVVVFGNHYDRIAWDDYRADDSLYRQQRRLEEQEEDLVV